jgi:hypothetical protein
MNWEEELEATHRLERQLREALKREMPDPGFAERVVAASRRPRLLAMPRWLAPAAAVVVIAGGTGLAWRQYQGMAAKEQVMQAARITAGTLRHIQAQMKEGRQ